MSTPHHRWMYRPDDFIMIWYLCMHVPIHSFVYFFIHICYLPLCAIPFLDLGGHWMVRYYLTFSDIFFVDFVHQRFILARFSCILGHVKYPYVFVYWIILSNYETGSKGLPLSCITDNWWCNTELPFFFHAHFMCKNKLSPKPKVTILSCELCYEYTLMAHFLTILAK